MVRVIFHLDMDAFYASIEQRDNPALRDQPVIVGAPPSQRGVVCAASYEARKYGVRSAMPSATACRLCPRGIFLPPRMDAYRDESHQIMDIVARTGALIEPVSIDEAYLDLSARFATNNPEASLYQAVALARDLKRAIFEARQLTASIGIAANKFLAKIGSDFNKPDGLTLIPERDKVEFLRPMPVRVIHGVGQVTEQMLQGASIQTIGDLQDYAGDLKALVGSWAHALRRFAFGEDDRPVDTRDVIKSISCEETFARDTDDRPVLRKFLKDSADDLAARLKRRQLGAHTVQVKVRYGDFSTLTRQISVEEPITDAAQIYRLGCFLLGRHRLVSKPLRLLGLGVSGLAEPAARQLELL